MRHGRISRARRRLSRLGRIAAKSPVVALRVALAAFVIGCGAATPTREDVKPRRVMLSSVSEDPSCSFVVEDGETSRLRTFVPPISGADITVAGETITCELQIAGSSEPTRTQTVTCTTGVDTVTRTTPFPARTEVNIAAGAGATLECASDSRCLPD